MQQNELTVQEIAKFCGLEVELAEKWKTTDKTMYRAVYDFVISEKSKQESQTHHHGKE